MQNDIDMPILDSTLVESSTTHRLSALLNARSVAVIGASSDPKKISGRPIAYMLAQGYEGAIYPVNPGREEVQGLSCYPNIAAINAEIDLAIIGTAAQHVESAIQEGIRAGVKAFVVFSSGFAELDEEGRAMQQRLSALARRHGVAIVGPNCLGVANSRSGLLATFTTALESHELQPGHFSFVSQSGALGAYWMDIVLRSGIGFAQWITTGNESDVDAAETIDFLIDDPDTHVIGVYLEDIRNGHAFKNALARAAQARKPVIVIKAGSSSAGAAAAASHTGALAGDDALYEACLEQYGALRVHSLTEMMEVARLLLHGATPLGPKLAVMTVSGGAGVLIADACEPLGLALPPLQNVIREALGPVLPSFVLPNNPLDITGNVLQDTPMISRAMGVLAQDKDVHAIVLYIGMMHSIADAFVAALSDARKKVHCPIIVIWVGAMPESIRALEAVGIPVFMDIPQATQAMAKCVRANDARLRAPKPAPYSDQAPEQQPGALRTLSEWQGKLLLRHQHAVALPEGRLMQRNDAVLWEGGFPVAAKLQSEKLLHKSDCGGVQLGIRNKTELAQALARLCDLGEQMALPVEGILVEPMLGYDHELLLGLRRDERFGPVLTLARGGVEAELSPDVVTLLLPANANDIQRAIGRLRCSALLRGYRGRPGADVAALAQRIAALAAWFERQLPLSEVEINPLAIRGDEAWALDALITTLG